MTEPSSMSNSRDRQTASATRRRTGQQDELNELRPQRRRGRIASRMSVPGAARVGPHELAAGRRRARRRPIHPLRARAPATQATRSDDVSRAVDTAAKSSRLESLGLSLSSLSRLRLALSKLPTACIRACSRARPSLIASRSVAGATCASGAVVYYLRSALLLQCVSS